MSTTISLAEIVNKTCALPTREEKIKFLQTHNSQSLRTLLSVLYDPEKYVWNIPSTSIPPYTPSVHVESHGMLYRQTRKLRYFIKGYDGENLSQYRREALFIEMLETIDRDDAKLIEAVLLQKPLDGLSADMITEAFGIELPAPKVETKKRGRKV